MYTVQYYNDNIIKKIQIDVLNNKYKQKSNKNKLTINLEEEK